MVTRIRSDIEYLDGPLAGLRIVGGFNVTCGDRTETDRTVAWVHKVRASDDFVRAVGTGHCYRFVGEITRERADTPHACARCGMIVPDRYGTIPCWNRDCPE